MIRSQRIQWLGHVIRRREDAIVRLVLQCKPEVKRPMDRSRKRWIDGVGKDLEDSRVRNRRELVQDRDGRNDLVVAAKTVGE